MTAPTKPGRVVWRVYFKHGNNLEIRQFDSAAERNLWAADSRAYKILPPVRITTVLRLHGFGWALKQMKAGKTVRRLGGLYRIDGTRMLHQFVDSDETTWGIHGGFTSAWLFATDWELASTESK